MAPPWSVLRGRSLGRARAMDGFAATFSLSRSKPLVFWCTVAVGRATPASSSPLAMEPRRALSRLWPGVPLPLSLVSFF